MAVVLPALFQTLARATRRVRILLALRHGATGLLAGAFAAGALLALLRLGYLEEWPAETLMIPPLVGLLAGAVWGATRRVSALDIARLTEQRLDLKERLSTALSLAPVADADPLAARQLADAEAHASRGLDLKTAVPLALPRRAWIALAAALVVLGAWFAPALPLFQSPQQRAEKAAVKKEGARLVHVAKALERDAGAKKLDQTRKAAQKLGALGQKMERGQLDKQKALMKLAKMTDEVKQSQQALAAASAPKSLAAAGKELQKALQSAEGMPKDGGDKKPGLNAPSTDPKDPKNAQNSAAKAAAATAAMRKTQKALAGGDMSSLAEQLSQLAQQAQRGEPGTPANREKLARQLGALSKALQGTSLEKASEPLKQAAEAMKKGDLQQASQALQEAARRVAESGKKSEDAQGMQQMAQALADSSQMGESQEAQEAQEGEGTPDMGEGAGENDAFDKNGKPNKNHVHTAACLGPGGT